MASIEDRLAISELVAAYSDAVSRNDADAWAATWDEGAEWHLLGQVVHGRNAIAAAWRAAMAQFDAVSFIAALGPVTVEGDRAAARCQTQEVLRAGGAVRRIAGVYDDAFVRRDGRWRFARRAFRIVIEH